MEGFRRGKLADTAVGATLDHVQEALQFRGDGRGGGRRREGQKSDRLLSRSPLDRALCGSPLTLSYRPLTGDGQELRLNRVWPISRTRAEATREFAIQSPAIILKLRLSHSLADETLVRVHGARLGQSFFFVALISLSRRRSSFCKERTETVHYRSGWILVCLRVCKNRNTNVYRRRNSFQVYLKFNFYLILEFLSII